MAGDPNKARTTLDGALDKKGDKAADKTETKSEKTPSKKEASRPFTRYAALSKVGYVPFNPHKVNQDRYCEVLKLGDAEHKCMFGVFDGHGAVGHEVSEFVSRELPNFFLKQGKLLESDPNDAITKAFVDCNTKLCKDSIDCAFSGTTCIVTYINGKTMYSCNAGDSRAVLAKKEKNGKFKAVALSSDHKPDRPDEKKRIHESKGRVEPCKGLKGEDIGPPRVWLMHQDVPGLAMTRSFGDVVASSVGVSSKPEIWDRQMADDDSFMILASDGVWEFISNQEAVDLVGTGKDPQDACRLLCEEATRRWQKEEEVVDDISCVIVYF
jgi:serine/threonine protein phosphatase PrpC